MRAGRLRHRVTIQHNTPTRNSVGEEIDTWSEFATRSAAVIPLSGREAYAVRQRYAEAEFRIELRHLAGATPTMRVAFDNRFFDILAAINPDERGRETHLICKERL